MNKTVTYYTTKGEASRDDSLCVPDEVAVLPNGRAFALHPTDGDVCYWSLDALVEDYGLFDVDWDSLEPSPYPYHVEEWSVDDDGVAELLQEAAEHGDDEMVSLCRKALAGDEAARWECYDVICDAKL